MAFFDRLFGKSASTPKQNSAPQSSGSKTEEKKPAPPAPVPPAASKMSGTPPKVSGTPPLENGKKEANLSTNLPFGMWLGISGSSQAEIVRAFSLTDLQPCPWAIGVREACRGFSTLFVTDAINGHNLVVGNALPDLAYRTSTIQWLAEMSAHFPRLTAFIVQPRVEVYGFAYAERGALYRIYAVAQGSVKTCLGDPTEAEDHLGYIFPETDDELFDGIGFTPPTAATICTLAAHWGADVHHATGSPGILGTIVRP